MASGGLMDELEDILSCQICFEEFSIKTPRQLSCLHVFCEECIENILAHTNTPSGYVICPVCKVNTDVPEGHAADLPLFFYSRTIEEIKKKLDEKYTVCKVCQTETHKAYITSYCFECYSGLCGDCRIKHDKHHQKHTSIHVTSSTINYIICKDHDSHFEYFCMTCKRAICSNCCIGLHTEHQVYDLTYDGKGVSDEVKTFLMSKLKLTDDALERLDNVQDDATIRTKEIRSEIDKHHDLLIEELNMQYTALCVELDEIQDGIMNDIEISRDQLQETKQRITNLMEENKSWLEPVEGISEAHVIGIDEIASAIKHQMSYTDVILHTLPSVYFIVGSETIDLGNLTVSGAGSVPSPRTIELEDLNVGDPVSFGERKASISRLKNTAEGAESYGEYRLGESSSTSEKVLDEGEERINIEDPVSVGERKASISRPVDAAGLLERYGGCSLRRNKRSSKCMSKCRKSGRHHYC